MNSIEDISKLFRNLGVSNLLKKQVKNYENIELNSKEIHYKIIEDDLKANYQYCIEKYQRLPTNYWVNFIKDMNPKDGTDFFKNLYQKSKKKDKIIRLWRKLDELLTRYKLAIESFTAKYKNYNIGLFNCIPFKDDVHFLNKIETQLRQLEHKYFNLLVLGIEY